MNPGIKTACSVFRRALITSCLALTSYRSLDPHWFPSYTFSLHYSDHHLALSPAFRLLFNTITSFHPSLSTNSTQPHTHILRHFPPRKLHTYPSPSDRAPPYHLSFPSLPLTTPSTAPDNMIISKICSPHHPVYLTRQMSPYHTPMPPLPSPGRL